MKYTLAEACQNTFLLFDCLNETSLDAAIYEEAKHSLEKEKRDDALILMNGVQKGPTYYAQMIVVGLDGQLGEFCGNGSRASAAYFFKRFPDLKICYLLTDQGPHPIKRHSNGDYSIYLPKPSFQWNPKFITNWETFCVDYGNFRYVEVIEPHVTLHKKINAQELFEWGKELNQRKDLFPHGINVNAWHVDNGDLFVQTYERGVQRLTKSCGTGSLSCAACFKNLGHLKVITAGGHLEISQQQEFIELRGAATLDA